MKKLIDCLKVGDKVFNMLNGWGVVESLYKFNDSYPIEVKFDEYSSLYTEKGKQHEYHINPSLFLEEIKLEQKLPEFVEGEIVLANNIRENLDFEFEYWFLAKYIKFENGFHIVNPISANYNGDIVINKWEEKVKNCKSFDKSHFESK